MPRFLPYDAYWFLYDHPKLRCATLSMPSDGEQIEISRYVAIKKMRERDWSGKPTGRVVEVRRHKRLYQRAMEINLDIHYAKVDDTRTVNDDPAKNHITECWLEIGPVYYEVSDGILSCLHSHDLRLDCGGDTFDEALVKLARLVRKFYGDYRTKSR